MIRKFRPSDENACIKIIAKCFDNSIILNKKAKAYVKNLYTTKGYLIEKSHKYDVFVYEKNRKVWGMGTLQGDYIGKVYVNPIAHGIGIGQQIVSFLEKVAVKRGYKQTTLHAYQNSRRFYLKRGYKFTKMFIYSKQNNIRIPTYEMRKTLSKD
jgi:ribosomal protein S18 acetylase RimI-like enzyme